MTLQQVIEFSNGMVIENYGMNSWTWGLLITGVFLMTASSAMSIPKIQILLEEKWKMSKRNHFAYFTLLMTGGMFCFLMTVAGYQTSPESAIEKYKAQQAQWEQEYVFPYIDTLPIQSESIKKVQQDYMLAGNSEKNSLEADYPDPVQIETESGTVIKGWAQTIPVDTKEEERVEFIQLKKELLFGQGKSRKYNNPEREYTTGFYRIKVYVKE